MSMSFCALALTKKQAQALRENQDWTMDVTSAHFGEEDRQAAEAHFEEPLADTIQLDCSWDIIGSLLGGIDGAGEYPPTS